MPLLKPPRQGTPNLPELLFRPRSVALIGAGTVLGAHVLRTMRTGGFAGPMAAVTR